ncbi:HET-domain-containing protein [Acephala macrosclerotiorum]|nr:HET-domain-containing protein [Acephala macrosclerotiorum]
MAFQRVHKWVENCDRGHDCDKNHSCHKNKDSPTVPTRLLEMTGSEETIRVVELGDQREHYLALSHCWGLSHRITTTKENIAKHRGGIPINQLPKTFREAVFIARELGIRYLWIDSLCIIQDDFSDWEHEASRMGSVYAHAYFTISALSSADDSSGCFREGSDIKTVSIEKPHISCDSWTTGRRAVPLAAPLIVGYNGDGVNLRIFQEMAMRGDRKTRVYVTFEWMPPSLKDSPRSYLVGQFGRKVDPFEHEPLNKRAWTLQERLLSARTLHYGSQEMYWECQYCVLCEDGAMMQREFPTLEKVLASRTPGAKDKSQHDIWHKLVEEYTARSLTRDQDKLPALSGLANSIAAKTGDGYAAGLWKRNIIKDLFWSVETIEPSHKCDDPEHDATMPPATKASVKRPTQYRAPSWSWASLDGKIEYWRLNEDTIQARCLDIHVSPAGKDKFGRVQLGWMTIEGPPYLLRPLEWSQERYKRVFKYTVLVELRNGTGIERFGEGHAKFDDKSYFPSFALRLDNEHAIILKGNGLRTFTRIGTVSSIRMSSVANAPNSAGLDEQGKNDSEQLAYSVEEVQAAEIANGSPQIVTIF